MKDAIKLGLKIILNNLGIPKLYQLNFCVSYWCNSRCKHCNIWTLKPKDELTLEEIRKFTKNMKYIQWVRLTGGEPFIRREYVDIVRAFHDNCKNLYLLSTPTNSLQPDITIKDVKQVLSFFNKKYIITVSLDGYEELHDHIRGIKGNFKKAIHLYKELSKLRTEYKNFDVVLGYTINPFNIGHFEETFDKVKGIIPEVNIENFHINLAEISNHYFHNIGMRLDEDYRDKAIKEVARILSLRKELNGLRNRIENKYLELAMLYLQTKKTPIPCNILNMSTYVDSFGYVYPCIIYDRKIGNIRDHNYNLKEVLKLDVVKTIKKETKELKCPNCWTPCEAHDLILSNWRKLPKNNPINKA